MLLASTTIACVFSGYGAYHLGYQSGVDAPRWKFRPEPGGPSAEELKADKLTVRVPPMAMRLVFANVEDFHKVADQRTLAFTESNIDPCEIVLPAGVEIEATLSTGRAWWTNDQYSDTIPHEILHCLKGSWHPPDDEEEANRKKHDDDDKSLWFQYGADLTFPDGSIKRVEEGKKITVHTVGNDIRLRERN
jgi:hypothetical protein